MLRSEEKEGCHGFQCYSGCHCYFGSYRGLEKFATHDKWFEEQALAIGCHLFSI